MPEPDHYQVLGVQPTATMEQIKAAYRRQALKYHPDKNPSSSEAVERFQLCSAAYAVLSDPDKRAEYDRSGRGRGVEDLARGLIDDLFGTKLGRKRAGQDVRFDLVLTFQEAALGTTRRISFASPDLCDACAGSGAAPGGRRGCPACGGRGESGDRGFFTPPQPCPRCGGQGVIITDTCKTCNGVGMVERSREYEVKLPPGVRKGDVKIIDGAGERGQAGGKDGDLQIVIAVEPHPLFSQDGADIIVEVPVSFSVVALGGVVEVPTLYGRVRMKVPAGTQSGRVFRLPGKGLPATGPSRRRGDQLVRVEVETPVGLGPRQQELLRAFAESMDASSQPLCDAYADTVEDGGR